MRTITIYRDKRKEWRWKLSSANGNILADSGEGYKRKSAAKKAAMNVITARYPLQVVVNEPKK